ncbi:hypothetical protein BHE74_00046283 [Ensete ventricosum]|nr:hypothetical protein BHE74_00046283 [Ensete ventricosum]
MIRFRPIAPKPAAGSPSTVAAPVEAAAAARRPKRKGSAGPACGKSGRKPRKAEANPSPSSSTMVTLSLIPETPERKGDPETAPKRFPSPPSAVVVPHVVPPVGATGSWVTVECVTDAWREGEVAWRGNEAVAAALAADECPGFMSDEWDRVTWINEAYRRMAVGTAQHCSSLEGGGAEEKEEEVRVGLPTEEDERASIAVVVVAGGAVRCVEAGRRRLRVEAGREGGPKSQLVVVGGGRDDT